MVLPKLFVKIFKFHIDQITKYNKVWERQRRFGNSCPVYCEESLSKCIDNHEQFFENIVHDIKSGLQDYYKKVWNNKDKIQKIITKNKNRFYRQGDIIGIPIDINAKCKVKSILDENNNYEVSNKHINDIWKVVMYFFIKN